MHMHMHMDMHMHMHMDMHMHMRMLHVCPGVGQRTDRLVQPDEATRPARVKRTQPRVPRSHDQVRPVQLVSMLVIGK